MVYFLVGCGGFERDRLVLLNDVCRIVGARDWLDEFFRGTRRERGYCCWEKEGIYNRVMEDVGECVLYIWIDSGR